MHAKGLLISVLTAGFRADAARRQPEQYSILLCEAFFSASNGVSFEGMQFSVLRGSDLSS
jgi:hypothetical protein